MAPRGGSVTPENRSRSRTGLVNTRTGQSRATASRRSPRSGFTAYAWPTASSIGTSVTESL